mgnify:CR=1 FL=1
MKGAGRVHEGCREGVEEVEVGVKMVVETMEVAEAAGARGQGRLAGCDFWRRAVRSQPCEGSCTRDNAIGRRGARCVPQESRRVRAGRPIFTCVRVLGGR